MFDRQSETWWQQLTGEGLVGDYAGALLDIVPSQVIGFSRFAERYPNGLVMSRETGYNRQYGTNPYSNYDSRPGRPFLFRGEMINVWIRRWSMYWRRLSAKAPKPIPLRFYGRNA